MRDNRDNRNEQNCGRNSLYKTRAELLGYELERKHDQNCE